MLFFVVKFKEWGLFLKVIFVIGVLLGLSMIFCYCTFLLGGFLGYARNDSGPATAGSYVFVCCVWIAHLRLGGLSILLTLHSGRHGGKRACRPERNVSGVERVSLFSAATLYIVLGLCLLCMCCTSTVRGSFDFTDAALRTTGGKKSVSP